MLELNGFFCEQFCYHKELECADCLLQKECAYARLFEAPSRPDEVQRRGQKHGTMSFILQPPITQLLRFPPGAELLFGIVVVGPQIETFPYLLCAIQELAHAGLGADRNHQQGRFDLIEVEAKQGDSWVQVFEHQQMPIPAPHSYMRASDLSVPSENKYRVRLSFVTPMRIKVSGGSAGNHESNKRRVLRHLDFVMIFSSLGRRISFLLHDQEKIGTDFRYQELFATAQQVETEEKEFRWYEWTRYSIRKQKHMQLAGVMGDMTLNNVSALQLWLLQLGEWFHVGKQNSFGMGQIKVECLPSTE